VADKRENVATFNPHGLVVRGGRCSVEFEGLRFQNQRGSNISYRYMIWRLELFFLGAGFAVFFD